MTDTPIAGVSWDDYAEAVKNQWKLKDSVLILFLKGDNIGFQVIPGDGKYSLIDEAQLKAVMSQVLPVIRGDRVGGGTMGAFEEVAFRIVRNNNLNPADFGLDDVVVPPVPATDIYVQDYAGILSDSAKHDMLEIAATLDRRLSAKVVVVTVDSFEGVVPGDYATALEDKWVLTAGVNNWAVIVVDKAGSFSLQVDSGVGNPRQKAIEAAGQELNSLLKKGDFDKAVWAGFKGVVTQIAAEHRVKLSTIDPGGLLGGARRVDMGRLSAAAILLIAGVLAWPELLKRARRPCPPAARATFR